MKSPRELLLSKHQHMENTLDAISERVCGEYAAPKRQPRSGSELLRRWFWPAPAAWGGIAAVWIIIASLNVASSERPERRITAAKPSPDTIAALCEQKELFVELVNPTLPDVDVDRSSRRPRSECRQIIALA